MFDLSFSFLSSPPKNKFTYEAIYKNQLFIQAVRNTALNSQPFRLWKSTDDIIRVKSYFIVGVCDKYWLGCPSNTDRRQQLCTDARSMTSCVVLPLFVFFLQVFLHYMKFKTIQAKHYLVQLRK